MISDERQPEVSEEWPALTLEQTIAECEDYLGGPMGWAGYYLRELQAYRAAAADPAVRRVVKYFYLNAEAWKTRGSQAQAIGMREMAATVTALAKSREDLRVKAEGVRASCECFLALLDAPAAPPSATPDAISRASTEEELLALIPAPIADALRSLRGALPGTCPEGFEVEGAEAAFDTDAPETATPEPVEEGEGEA
jgi:hypothetical protein